MGTRTISTKGSIYGKLSDNYYTFMYGRNSERQVLDSNFDESKVKREAKGHKGAGRFTTKPETIEEQDMIPLPPPLEEVSPEEFAIAIASAKKSTPEDRRWRVDAHAATDYKGAVCLVSKGGSCVAKKQDGDIVSVCRTDTDAGVVRGSDLLDAAIREGGDRLDSFDGNWRFYLKNGFLPVSWTPFNEEYAPEGWNPLREVKEDVIFFVYVGKANVNSRLSLEEWKNQTPPCVGENGYDEAKAIRDGFISQMEKANDK